MTWIMIFAAVCAIAVLTVGATAVRAVSRLWLRHWIEHRVGGVGAMARYLERPTRLVHTAGTAAMLLVFTTGSVIAMNDGLRAWAFVRDVTLFLLLLLVFGQLLPRAIGRRWAPQLVPMFVPLLRVTDLMLAPFHSLANGIRRVVVRPAADGSDDMRDGLEELLRDETFRDIGATEEMALISGVVQFGDKIVRDVMTPRSDVFMLPEGVQAGELARQMSTAGYSRVPIYRESPDQITGMMHVFDVFRRRGETMPAVRPVTFTRADKPAKDLLFELLRSRRQLAIVQDEGLMVGLVTLEDLLEELVGDIRDEHDDSSE